MADDITVTILREIRDAILATNTRLDATNERLDSLETNVTAQLAAVTTELEAVKDKLDAVARFTKNISKRHDKAIDELRERVAKLEGRRRN